MRSGLCLWIRALKARPSFQLWDRKHITHLTNGDHTVSFVNLLLFLRKVLFINKSILCIEVNTLENVAVSPTGGDMLTQIPLLPFRSILQPLSLTELLWHMNQCRPNKTTNISLYARGFVAVFCKTYGSPFINDDVCNFKKPWQNLIHILNVLETIAKISLHQRLMLQLESNLRCVSVCMHVLPNVEVLYVDILVGSRLPLAPKEKTLLCRGLCTDEKRRKKS